MRLTVLGTGTIAFSASRSCSGYYVETGAAKVLMDCGSGITRRLAELGIPWQDITHVAVTHFHIDHHADLPSLIFAWKYGQLPSRSAPIDVIGPVGTQALLEKLAAAYGDWDRSNGTENGLVMSAVPTLVHCPSGTRTWKTRTGGSWTRTIRD